MTKFKNRYVLGVGYVRDNNAVFVGLFKDEDRGIVRLKYPSFINRAISEKEPKYRLVLERVRPTKTLPTKATAGKKWIK